MLGREKDIFKGFGKVRDKGKQKIKNFTCGINRNY